MIKKRSLGQMCFCSTSNWTWLQVQNYLWIGVEFYWWRAASRCSWKLNTGKPWAIDWPVGVTGEQWEADNPANSISCQLSPSLPGRGYYQLYLPPWGPTAVSLNPEVSYFTHFHYHNATYAREYYVGIVISLSSFITTVHRTALSLPGEVFSFSLNQAFINLHCNCLGDSLITGIDEKHSLARSLE